MHRLLLVFVVIGLVLSGCLAVMGREPTQEEIDALMRGEKLPPRDGSKPEPDKPKPPPKPDEPVAQPAGPTSGIVLRWMDAATVTIDCDGRLEVVRLVGVTVPADNLAAENARMKADQDFPYGTKVRVIYPTKDKAGNLIYRDADERLVATIEAEK